MAFKVDSTFTRKVSNVSVQFKATLEEIDKVRRCLKNPGMSYGDIGKHALKYFIEQECP